jgi:hypothetical protein
MSDMKCCFGIVPTVRAEENLTEIFVKLPKDLNEVMHTGIVRNANLQPDTRFRPRFSNWRATVTIEFDARMVTAKQLIEWMSRGGISNGICEMRRAGKAGVGGDSGSWSVVGARVVQPKL